MSKVKLHFKPDKTIKQVATEAGLSEIAVRKYLRRNNISARQNNYEYRLHTVRKAVKQLEAKQEKATIKRICELTTFSKATVIKYLKVINENGINIDTKLYGENVSFFRPNAKSVIKSVDDNQHRILLNILRLFTESKKVDVDLTFSKGAFYKNGISQPLYKFDKYPQSKDVKLLKTVEKLPDNKVMVVVCDPPFIISTGGTIDERGKSTKKGSSIISNRFGCFKTIEELHRANEYLVQQSYRILKEKGILIYKIQDTVSSGRQIWTSHFVINTALSLGFELLDTFVLIAKSKVISGKHINQVYARKYHSYFLVFRK